MSLAVVLGIALLVLYWAWIGVFFGRVRPRIMEALGRRLGVSVRESTNVLTAGTYEARGERTPLRKSGAIYAVDLVVCCSAPPASRAGLRRVPRGRSGARRSKRGSPVVARR